MTFTVALPIFNFILPSQLSVPKRLVVFEKLAEDDNESFPRRGFCPINCSLGRKIYKDESTRVGPSKVGFVSLKYSYHQLVFEDVPDVSFQCCKNIKSAAKGMILEEDFLFFPKLLFQIFFSWLPALALFFLILWVIENVRSEVLLPFDIQNVKFALITAFFMLLAIILYNLSYLDWLKQNFV